MNLSQRLALGTFVLLALLFSASRVLQQGPAAHAGVSAPPCHAGMPARVAEISASHFVDRGERMLTTAAGRTILLQLHHWSVVEDAGVRGPYGSGRRGAPGYIAAAIAADIHQDTVYVLDAAARAVHVFELAGRFRRTIRLEIPERTFWQSVALFVDSAAITVVTFEPEAQPARWRLRHWRAGERYPRTSFATPGTSLEGIVAARDSHGFLIGEQHAYRILRLRDEQPPAVVFARHDPPKLGFTNAERRNYARFTTRMPGALQQAYRLPEFVPPLVAFRRLPNGSLASARAHGPDSVVIELAAPGSHLCAVTAAAIPRPFALHDEGVAWLDELTDITALNWLRYQP